MRIPPRRILMPFAFSKPSFEAWGFAREFARRCGAELTAVHVEDWLAPVGEAPPVPPSSEQRRAARARLAKAVGPEVKIRYAAGPVITAVLELIEDLRPDLVLMATEGRTGLRRLLRDSVTEEVVRRSPVPVLAVHGQAAMPTSVLAPVNAQPYSLAGLSAAESWARFLEVPLTLLHVREAGDPRSGVMTRKELRERAAASPVETRLRLQSGAPVRRIIENARGGALVTLVAHRKGVLRDLLGTTAEQVLRHVPGPVLTIPAPGRPPRRRAAKRRQAASRPPRKTLSRRTII